MFGRMAVWATLRRRSLRQPRKSVLSLALLRGESSELLLLSSTRTIRFSDSVPHWYKTGEHVTGNRLCYGSEIKVHPTDPIA